MQQSQGLSDQGKCFTGVSNVTLSEMLSEEDLVIDQCTAQQYEEWNCSSRC